MSNITDRIRRAADILESDMPGIDFATLRRLTADWMRGEAETIDAMPALARWVNVEIERTSGVTDYLHVGRTEEGEIQMSSETTGHALAIAAEVEA